MAGFSHGQRQAIVVATQTVASLSFVGSAIIVFTNFRFKQVRLMFICTAILKFCCTTLRYSWYLSSHSSTLSICG